MKVVIFGCGGHSRSVSDVLLEANPGAELVFVDEQARPDERIRGFAVRPRHEHHGEKLFFAIGDNRRRSALFSEHRGHDIISVISVHARVSTTARIGRGCFLGNGCHIGPDAIVGDNTVVNTASIVEHETVVGHSCHLGPGAVVCGRCTLGDEVFVGAGTTVVDGVAICSGVTVGAGSVVIAHIVEPGVYVGCPARKIR
jgi:UDP-N-acetylbacillosamine N-acetyltransferase